MLEKVNYDTGSKILLNKEDKDFIERHINKNYPNEKEINIKVEDNRISIYNSDNNKIDYFHTDEFLD